MCSVLLPGEFVVVLDGKKQDFVEKQFPKKTYKNNRDYGVSYDEADVEKRHDRIMAETTLRLSSERIFGCYL